MRITYTKSGYTLLFAVLIASLVLGVATFILGIARKQYILSSATRDSMYSFYAADSGIECIAKNSNAAFFYDMTVSSSIDCGGQNRVMVDTASPPPLQISGPYYIYTLHTTLGFAADGTDPTNANNRWGCADVTIVQTFDGIANGSSNLKQSVTNSRGYNICDYSLATGVYTPQNSPRTVERYLAWSINAI